MQIQVSSLNFKDQNIYVGLDVHKKSWNVTIMSDKLTHKTFSQPSEAKPLGNYLRKNFPGGNYLLAYESGFCGFSVHRELEKEGIKTIVVNPADIPTTDKERKQKEDKRDSRKIAKSLRNNELEAIYVPSKETEELRSLLKCQSDTVKELTRYKNRIKSMLYYYGVKIPESYNSGSKHFSKAYINWLSNISFDTWQGKYSLDFHIEIIKELRNKLLDVNRQIRKTSKEKKYNEDFNLLISVPGISLITAMNLIAEIEDITRFKNFDHLCAYVGLVPSTNSSGENEKVGSVTKRSNKRLRSLLIESAWVAARQDPALIMSYEQLCKRMKASKAIIRIAKKLLRRIRFILKNKQKYEYAIVS